MAKLLFRLKDVPDDEANAIRELLNEHGLDCYETEEGRWRVGLAAIWLRDDERFDEARALIDQYEEALFETQQRNAETSPDNLWQSFIEHPLRFLFAIVAIAAIALISIYPFWTSMHS